MLASRFVIRLGDYCVLENKEGISLLCLLSLTLVGVLVLVYDELRELGLSNFVEENILKFLK